MKNKNISWIILILLCFSTYIFSNGSWAIPLLAWIYPILFLQLLNKKNSLKICFLILGIFTAGFMVQFTEVIGNGIIICALAAIIISVLKTIPYLIYCKSKKDFKGTLLFAAGAVAAEYGIYLIYPIVAGLSDAYTQYQNLLLIQITTILGIYGIVFIINWTASMVVLIWNRRGIWNNLCKAIAIYCTVMACIFTYNAFMLYFNNAHSESVRVAAVTVPVSHLLNEDSDVKAVIYSNDFTDLNLINTKRKLAAVQDELFQKSYNEAVSGAKIIFWSELNGVVMKEDEKALLSRAAKFAVDNDVYFMISLLVKTPYKNLKENKTVAFNPQGKVVSEYFKFGRSFGELCIKGDGKIKLFDTKYGKIAPFICSDMAFTTVITQAGRNGVDILLDPASDWKEMSPIAIKTAVIRGVENGCAILRHTNEGISVATDSSGKLLAYADYFNSDTKTVTAQIPTGGRFTVYPYIRNLFANLCVLYVLGCLVLYIRIRRRLHMEVK
nr:nitrilase-related carbon-nitrogen hydrolase [Anaerocolumna chitinilytica]